MTKNGRDSYRLFLGTVVLTLAWVGCVAAEPRNFGEAGLSIIEPADGATVAPGQMVNFKVEVIPEALPGFVLITSDVKTVHVPFGGRLDGPPFEGPVEISRSASGVVEVGVFLISREEGALAGRKIKLNVVSAERPTRIEVQGHRFLPPPGSAVPPDRSKLKVLGHFEGDVRRDVSGPEFGTTYTSLTPDIISVASNGALTALNPGYGFIAVENGGLRQYAEVVIDTAQGVSPPAEDKTTSVAIQASGFRRDPGTGFFVQQLTLRNSSTVPLAKAIHLVIDDLPVGVELKDTMGRPSAASGQIVRVDVKSENFLSPGETATATLKFSNREGTPITYSRKVYCGKRP